MNFNPKQLHDALKIAFKCVIKNPILSITKYAVIERWGELINITTTDLEIYTRISYYNDNIPTAISGDKKTFMVDSRILRLLRNAISCEIENIEGGEFITINHLIKVKLMHYCDSGDFPALPSVHKQLFTDNSLFIDSLKNASLFTTSDELRPAMTGVNVSCEGSGVINIAASDGHKLVATKINNTTIADSFDFVLPKKAITNIEFKKLKTNTEVTCYAAASHCRIVYAQNDFDIEYHIRLITQKYPDFNAVIPDIKDCVKMAMNKKELLSALEMCKYFVHDETHEIRIHGNGVINNETNIRGYEDFFSVKLSISFEPITAQFSVAAFNAIFLEQIVKQVKGNDVMFYFINTHKPFLIVEEFERHKTINLIMPVIIY